MGLKCPACQRFVSPTGGATCTNCGNICHKLCVGFMKDEVVPDDWICPDCAVALPKGNRENTPVRGTKHITKNLPAQGVASPLTPCGHTTPLADSQESELVLEMRLFRDELRQTREEFLLFRQDMNDLRTRVATCEEQITSLETRVGALESGKSGEAGEGVKAVIHALETTVQQLKLDLNDRDQELLLNDLDITGIPEESGESVAHLVVACATKLGVTLDDRDLVCCTRVGAVRAASDGGGAAARPRTIVVRLARRATRDALLKAARVRRGANTEGLGLKSAPRPFYINERLTRSNRSLFNKAREARRIHHNWRFLWTRDGKIFARKDQGSPAHRIRTEDDLTRVFGPELVRSIDESRPSNG